MISSDTSFIQKVILFVFSSTADSFCNSCNEKIVFWKIESLIFLVPKEYESFFLESSICTLATIKSLRNYEYLQLNTISPTFDALQIKIIFHIFNSNYENFSNRCKKKREKETLKGIYTFAKSVSRMHIYIYEWTVSQQPIVKKIEK